MTRAFNIAHFWALLVTAVVVNGCTQVIETSAIDVYGNERPLCHSALGFYFLPRTLLNISAQANPSANSPTASNPSANSPTLTLSTATISATTIAAADRRQAFCLDYLGLATYDDIVTVQRETGGQGLLHSVNGNVTDKTPQIVANLVQTGENLAIAAARDARTAAAGQTIDTVSMQFDPFIWQDLMTAKVALRRFGYCLYVEDFSFPTYGLSPAAIRNAANHWCSTAAAETPPYQNPLYTLVTTPVSPEAMRTGILYRPKAAYKVVILRKTDPRSGDWTLFQIIRVEMVNASPVLSIGVERAAFTQRQTTLMFDHGTLTDVAVNKKSEAAGFVQIPLTIAQAIVDVPAQIIQFRIADTQSQAALIQAQGSLYQAVRDYSQLVAQQSPSVAAGVPSRSGQYVGGCIDAHGDPNTCARLGLGSR